MKIVVTGATGLIGSRLIHKLFENHDNHIIAISRSEKKLRSSFSDFLSSERFEYVSQDVSEPFDLESITNFRDDHPVDLIYHAASPISGDTIQKFPLEVIKPNLVATQVILDSLVKQKEKTGISGRVVIFSSATVYGFNQHQENSVTENETMQAESLDSISAPYSESKRMAEVITHAYIRQHGVDAVIVRPSYVYGDTLFPPETAMYSFIKAACRNQDIVLNKAGLSRRDNIHVDDVVEGLLAVVQKGKTGEAYNISSDGELGNFAAIDEIAEIIISQANSLFKTKLKVTYNQTNNCERKPGIKLNCDKLKELGWKPRMSLADGIVEMLKNKQAD